MFAGGTVQNMTPESLSTMLAGFLDGSRAAVVVEDGAVVFDLASAKYSVSSTRRTQLRSLDQR